MRTICKKLQKLSLKKHNPKKRNWTSTRWARCNDTCNNVSQFSPLWQGCSTDLSLFATRCRWSLSESDRVTVCNFHYPQPSRVELSVCWRAKSWYIMGPVRSDRRVAKCQCGQSELLIPTERAVKELYCDLSINTVHDAKVKLMAS